MRAYSTVPIKEWESFADRLKDDFHNLVDNDPNRTPQYLMDKAENKFKTMINEGSWDSKLKEKDEFLALKAEFNKFKKKHQRTGKGKGKGKGKPKPGKKRVDVTRKPRDIHKPVTIDGKQWYWCSKETGGKCSGVLRRHKPSECKGIAKSNDDASTSSSKRKSSTGDKTKKKLRLKANETVLNGGAEASDSDKEIQDDESEG